MKVLVTGGTGFVGRSVLGQLHQSGHSIVLAARKPGDEGVQRLAAARAVEVRAADVLDPASLAAAADGVEAVIHLVGIISEIGRNTFANAHVAATRNMLVAAQEAGVRRYLQMSALGTRPGAASRYHQTKWEAEELVRTSGLDWTIFRPSLIYGAEDHFVNLFTRLSRWSPCLPVMGRGEAKLQPVGVDEVAVCFVRALELPATVGRTYDLAGAERLSFVEVLEAILEAAGRRRCKLRIPLPLARLQATALEWVFPRLLGRAPPLNRDQLLMLTEDNVGDPTAAEAAFGLRFRGFRDGIGKRPG